MKQKAALFFCVVLILTVCLSGCTKYNESDFIGKTAGQIEAEYGVFDLDGTPFVSTDSSYHGFGYGYAVKEASVGFLGTTPAEYFFVVFDQNGIAVACYYGYISDGG